LLGTQKEEAVEKVFAGCDAYDNTESIQHYHAMCHVQWRGSVSVGGPAVDSSMEL